MLPFLRRKKLAFDYKKEYKDLYVPGKKVTRIEVPRMQFVAMDGSGDPNEENGAYQKALAVLYAISFAIRMSKRSGWEIPGYFEYVVPPLEGLWQQKGRQEFDPSRKDELEFTSVIRLPDFVSTEIFEEAKNKVFEKNPDAGSAYLFQYTEGECVQALHVGPYDTEPETMEKMSAAQKVWGLESDYGSGRRHHEIYLSDPRRTESDKLRTVLRTPVVQTGTQE